jgi:hypothetical protein
MALLGNYSVILKNPATFIGGTQVSNCRSAFSASGQDMQSFYTDDGLGLPATASGGTGTEPPYSNILAMKGGELSATTMLQGTGAIAPTMYISKDLSSTMGGSGTLEGSLSLLSQLATALAGVGALQGGLSLGLSLATTLSGTGALSPSLGLLVGMIANLSGSGTVSANLTGIARLEASIFVNVSTATVNELVAGVWNALAADYNATGTMGEAMNGAGSAGNPWITDLSAYNTANTAGKILKDRLSKGQFLGLK